MIFEYITLQDRVKIKVCCKFVRALPKALKLGQYAHLGKVAVPSMDRPTDAPTNFADEIRAIAGQRSKAAFTTVFQFYAPRLKTFLMRSGASDDEAEELVQDVMVEVWRKAAQYDPTRATVSTWIFSIARYRSIDKVRRLRRPAIDASDPTLSPPPPEPPEKQLRKGQIGEIIRTEIARLPDPQRAVLRAAFYDGLSHGEISQSFNLPIGTVKSRIRLAFSRLRAALEDFKNSP